MSRGAQRDKEKQREEKERQAALRGEARNAGTVRATLSWSRVSAWVRLTEKLWADGGGKRPTPPSTVDVIRVNTCRTSPGTFGTHSIARRRGSWAMRGAYERARATQMHPSTNGRRLGGVAKSLTAVLRTIWARMLSINHIENTLASSHPLSGHRPSNPPIWWWLICSYSSTPPSPFHLCSQSRSDPSSIPPLQTIMHTHSPRDARTHLASSLWAAFELWLNDHVNHAPVVPWQVYPVVVVYIYIYLLLIFRRGHDATSTQGEGKCGEMKRSVRVRKVQFEILQFEISYDMYYLE